MQRSKGLKRTSFKRKPPKKHRACVFDRGRLYDQDYMDWVARKPCCVPNCGRWPSTPAHTKALGRRGMGQKTSDRSVIPLCWIPHHLEFDQGKRSADLFAADHNLDIPAIVRALNEEYEQYVVLA